LVKANLNVVEEEVAVAERQKAAQPLQTIKSIFSGVRISQNTGMVNKKSHE
jgi:hypothetical protein